MINKKEMIDQLKWLYAALDGVCVAFLFTVLGSGVDIFSSFFLLASSVLFLISFVFFTAFTLAHIALVELEAPPEKYGPALNDNRVRLLTNIALLSICAAFILLIGHFSVVAMVGVLLLAIYALYELNKFIKMVKPDKANDSSST